MEGSLVTYLSLSCPTVLPKLLCNCSLGELHAYRADESGIIQVQASVTPAFLFPGLYLTNGGRVDFVKGKINLPEMSPEDSDQVAHVAQRKPLGPPTTEA